MANVLNEKKKQQILALGRLRWFCGVSSGRPEFVEKQLWSRSTTSPRALSSTGFDLFLIGSEADIVIGEGAPAKKQFLQMQVLGAKRGVSPIGIGRLGARTNYLISNDPKKWRVGIPNFDRVLFARRLS